MRSTGKLFLLGICAVVAPSLHAAISFAGSGGVGTDGNILTFNSGTFVVTASAWATTGNSGTTLATAALGQWNPYGLGVCNDSERASGSTCSTSPPEHAVGNNGAFDFILLTFSQPVYGLSFTLSTFNSSQDTDVSYFVGKCASVPNGSVNCSPTGDTLASLTVANNIAGLANVQTRNDLTGGTTDRVVNLDLSGTGTGGVNWVLIGATTLSGYTTNDYFKLQSMSYTTTPEPATFGLAGAALLGIGLLRRKKLFS